MLDGHVVGTKQEAARTPDVRLAVIEMDRAWRLFMDGERVGRFGAQRDALNCVLDMAREMRGAGMTVEVLAQNQHGELAWVEGASFRPQPHLTLVAS
ncbi:MAG: hypothetical protein KY449_04460 [Proteobacteria bacterium]|nr:hypothetical protein [Pseudomonadota bacterium]